MFIYNRRTDLVGFVSQVPRFLPGLTLLIRCHCYSSILYLKLIMVERITTLGPDLLACLLTDPLHPLSMRVHWV